MNVQPMLWATLRDAWNGANRAESPEGRKLDEAIARYAQSLVGSPLRVALEESVVLAAQGQHRRALDQAFAVIDRALRESKFRVVDRALRAFDFEGADLDLAVTVLMTCKPARTELPGRVGAVERLRRRVQVELPDRADAIIRVL